MSRKFNALFAPGLISLLSFAQPVKAVPDAGEMSNCEFAGLLCRTIGLGADELAIMNVDSAVQANIVADVETFCLNNRPELEPLLQEVITTRYDAWRAYELTSEDIADKDNAFVAALTVLLETCDALVTTIEDRLSGGQETLWQQRRGHPLFEAPVAMLDLSGGQITAILEAQRTRDAVLRHHCKRKDLVHSAVATSAFETAVASALDEGQETALAANREALVENSAALSEFEETHCEE